MNTIKKIYLVEDEESLCILLEKYLIKEGYAVGFFGDLVGASDGSYETFVSIIPDYLAIAAIAFASVIGLIAGYMPAKRATALSALTALRSD